MDADARRIDELERSFRRDGLPNLIVGLSATEGIFTRAFPFLAVVAVVEVVSSLGLSAPWVTLIAAIFGAAILFGGFGVINLARGRPLLALPDRVGIPELVGFVLVPALLTSMLRRSFLPFLTTILVNAGILLLTYIVVGFGIGPIVRWACNRLFAQLAASRTLLVRAVPMLLFFSLVMFFTMETWEVFTATGPGTYWTAVGMFVTLGALFLIVRLPTVVREMEADLDAGLSPLRRRERLNLAAVALISKALQVLFVSAAVWLFYVLLGTMVVSADVRVVWIGKPGDVVWELPWLGERVQVTVELLRVATGVASFAGLYYAVAILVDSANRDQFVDGLSRELQSAFRRRSEYLELLGRRGTADHRATAGPG